MLLAVVSVSVLVWALGALVVVAICRAAALGDEVVARAADSAERFSREPALRRSGPG